MMKIADGTIESIMCSNCSVKSKSFRQPRIKGPKEASAEHIWKEGSGEAMSEDHTTEQLR